MAQTVDEKLTLLLEKVERILALVEASSATARRRTSVENDKNEKAKAPPLTADEIAEYQTQFERLYQVWDSGEELQVENELDQMPADELRRFADANNLNVTSKTPKKKILQLIAGRFRERRQLTRSHFGRPRVE
ncbi:hypothetical protein [Bradyrhizobium sp. AZCC 1708]|uniref:hypothetical protein n=1 Tax=Bradyrhizobium sp. AZCC 1708 TaxID=3117015 RepID=UPI002FF2F90A